MILHGRPVSDVARNLSIGENIIYRWKSHRYEQPATDGLFYSLLPPPYIRDFIGFLKA